MVAEEVITTIDWWSLIASIVSVVLSIVAILFSTLFYFLSKSESKEISNKAQGIETQTAILKTVVDTLLSTSFAMIRENSQVMHKYLLGTVGETNESLTKDDSGTQTKEKKGIEEAAGIVSQYSEVPKKDAPKKKVTKQSGKMK